MSRMADFIDKKAVRQIAGGDASFVREKVLAIREAARSGDDERAHALEDDLYVTTLAAIAAGAVDARRLAKSALEASKIEFAHWCA